MKTWVLDASAVLRFTDREAGFELLLSLYEKAARGEVRLLMSAVIWGEVVHAVMKRTGARAEPILENLAALPMEVIPVDAAAATDAARFKRRYSLPYADSFAGALTLQVPGGASLLTADNDFRTLPPGTIDIEFLPGK